ncbi:MULTISPECIES: alkaline phosphatase family protein [Mumia]|uniref:alkaline phosphatase family protein n=1 Tax=Mumia TaxID=1546255 RepID=UPI00141FE821|nr:MULTISPECIES: alkaline phosphatase family protein [unclassified Mumia]QMW66938.1 alkaline phosphatase family protein [Mumia sp. ZJ1417]
MAVGSCVGLTVVGLLAAPATAASDSADDPVNRVVAISVDGLNPKAIHMLGRSRTPNFHRLMRQGAVTLNARTAREQTRTLPNHTGMLTGRRIDPRRGGHGVTFNDDTGTTVHRAAGRHISSVFDVVHNSGGSTALFAAKTKFALYQRTWNATIDRFTVDTDNSRLVTRVTAELRRAPRTFTFVHLSRPDQAGHTRGFMSRAYLRAVRRTDRLLGRILSTIRARPALRKHTLVVLTADHGGSGASHGDARRLANYRVPFMVWGPGVAAGRNLYRLSPRYRSPGSARTRYTGRQPIRNGDLANLVTDALDLPRVPGARFNVRRRLNAFR